LYKQTKPMSTVTEKINKLSPEQRALLEKKLRAKRQAAKNLSRITPRADQNTYPLSAGQQRLWTLEQMAPDSSAYNITDAFRLKGALNVEHLVQALGQTASRHETLRARFETVNGAPVQHVEPGMKIAVTQIDLTDHVAADRLNRAAQLATNSDNQPFDLTTGPLWRATLARLGEGENVLILTIHHIVADGWSLGLFTEEVSQHYALLASDDAHLEIADLPIQYADYAAWQSAWLADERAEKQLDYWSKKLAGLTEPLTLPVSKRGTDAFHSGIHAKRTIPQPLIVSAQQICQQNDISLFVFLLSAFQATLYRYTAQHDMVICTPIVSRRQLELEKLIGYFNNIVALRSSLTNETTFDDLLHQNKQVVLDAYEHQDLPFHLVTELPNLTRVPLSRALIALADYDGPALNLPGIAVDTLTFAENSADFDWSLFLNRTADGLHCELVYKSGLFDEEVTRTFLQDFQQMIEQSVANSAISLSQLPIDEKYLSNGSLQSADFVALDTYEAPIDEDEQKLAAVWCSVLEIKKIGRNQNFFDLGGHSMLAVRLFLEIEKQITGSTVPLSLLLQAPTVAQMAQALRGDALEDGFSLVVPIQTQGSKPPIFFIHPAGGNVLYYLDLAKYLAEHDQPSYGVQSQGMDGKQPILETVEEMSQVYVEHILRIQPQGPYLLSGYCLGGTIALEVAQKLIHKGHKVAFLGMLETYNWANMENESLSSKLQYQSQRVEFHLRNFMLLDGDGKQIFLKEKAKVARERSSMWTGSVKSLFGKNEESGKTEDALLSKIWATNDIAAEIYVPTSYAGKITQFVAKQDYAEYDDPALGWDDIAQSVDQRRMPVYPAGMLLEPFVRELAREMTRCIDEALE